MWFWAQNGQFWAIIDVFYIRSQFQTHTSQKQVIKRHFDQKRSLKLPRQRPLQRPKNVKWALCSRSFGRQIANFWHKTVFEISKFIYKTVAVR